MKKTHLVAAFVAMAWSFPLLAGPVDINTADAETLARELNGVGLSKAAAIVEYRDMHGAFKSAKDLAKVQGIGPATIEHNLENILLGNDEKSIE